MFGSAIGATDSSFESMTEGISADGMATLLENLKASILTEVAQQLEDTAEMETAFKSGWQGEARDAYLENFKKAITAVKDDLEAEYNDLVQKFQELQENYFNADKNLVDMI